MAGRLGSCAWLLPDWAVVTAGGVASALAVAYLAGLAGPYVLIPAATLAALCGRAAAAGWRSLSLAIPIISLSFGAAEPRIVVAAAAGAAAVAAWRDGAGVTEGAWRMTCALLAAVAAVTVAMWRPSPPLAAAAVFCALFYSIDAAGAALWVALRRAAPALEAAAGGVTLEAMVWLASAPLGAAVHGPAWAPGSGMAVLAAEVLLGLAIWAGAESLVRTRRQDLAVEELLEQLVTAVADMHAEPRVRMAARLARATARRLRAPGDAALRAEAAAALLAAGCRAEQWRLDTVAAASLRRTLRAAEEQFDGGGPEGLSGRAIPLESRIAAAVSCWIGLHRGGSERLGVEQSAGLLASQRGKTLDPAVAQALSAAAAEIAWPEAPAAAPSAGAGLLGGGRALPALSEEDSALLESSPQLLAAYFEILTVLAADLNFEHNLDECVRAIREAVGGERAALFLQEGEGFVLRRAQGFSELVEQRLRLPLDGPLLADPVWREDAEPVAAASDDPDLRRLLRGSRSVLSAPLSVDGRRLGAIVVLSPLPNAYETSHARFLLLAAGRLAAAVASSLALERMFREAQSDPVTGLPNVRAAMQRLDLEISRASRGDLPLAVLFLDIDRLKPVNDRYGHRAGDQLLAETARRLSAAMRRYDFLARVGGDEFLAILPGLRPADIAVRVEHLRRAIAGRGVTVLPGTVIDASVSIGAASFPLDGVESDALVAVSDRRMYADKRGHSGARADAVSA